MSELQKGPEQLNAVREQIAKTEGKLGNAKATRRAMEREQMEATERILRQSEALGQREARLKQLRGQKDHFKSQNIKNMHRNQDLRLKIRFFLEKVIEKNELQRKVVSERRGSTASDAYSGLLTKQGKVLSRGERKRLKKKRKRFNKKNGKDRRLDGKVVSCGSCDKCRVF